MRITGDSQFVAGGVPPDVSPVFTSRFDVLENVDPILLSFKKRLLSLVNIIVIVKFVPIILESTK